MHQTQPFILCIEDEAVSRSILQKLLCDVMGFTHVEIWPDSKDFTANLQALTEVPALVLMDIRVHPLDGYQMLRQLREHETLREVKAIALTASVMGEQVNKMKQEGFDGLIGKPIMRELFPQIIHKMLDGESIWYIP